MTSNFSSHTLSDPKKSLLSRNLRFALPPTKIDYTDFLVQFELFNRGTMEFTFSSWSALKKIKRLCFSTLNSYNLDKVNTNLTESEYKSLKVLIQHK